MRIWVGGRAHKASLVRALIAALDHYKPSAILGNRMIGATKIAAEWATARGIPVFTYPMNGSLHREWSRSQALHQCWRDGKPDLVLWTIVKGHTDAPMKLLDDLRSLGIPIVIAKRVAVVKVGDVKHSVCWTLVDTEQVSTVVRATT